MKHIIQKNGLVIAGGVIQGLGMGLFLFPHSIPSGGAGGITVLLNYWFGINMGTALWIVNFSDRKSTRLNSSHVAISYAVFCLKKKTYRIRPLAFRSTGFQTGHPVDTLTI